MRLVKRQDEGSLFPYRDDPVEEVDNVLRLQDVHISALDVKLGNPLGEEVAGLGVGVHRGHRLALLASPVVVPVNRVVFRPDLAAQLAGPGHRNSLM